MQSISTIEIGTSVVYKVERSRYPQDPNVQVGKIVSIVNKRGEVLVDWPGLPHLPQTHPVYRPQIKPVALDRLSPLT